MVSHKGRSGFLTRWLGPDDDVVGSRVGGHKAETFEEQKSGFASCLSLKVIIIICDGNLNGLSAMALRVYGLQP